eukprot:TRINITY_DN8020_c0_g1_i1.p1 TRINITY_DN8020_c0_g1~~TRINITY_DN8020_c0_g1_i1.p1  ORF type:complete len:507 (-),score=89.36 TRINITY_DN8020_c0_g1_i1:1200-2720(-)
MSKSRGLYRVLSDDSITDFIESDLESFDEEEEQYAAAVAKRRLIEEDAVPVKTKRWLTAAYCSSYCAMGVAYGSLGPSLEELVSRTGKSVEEVGGTLSTFRGIGWIVGSFIAGPLYERVRGHRLLWIAHLVTFLMCAITPFVSNLWLLVAVNIVQGAFMSWIEVGVNTLTVWVWKERVAPYMQLIHFGFGCGLSLFPAILGAAEIIGGSDVAILRMSFWTVAVWVLVATLFPVLLKSPAIEKDVSEHTHVVRKNRRETDRASATHVVSAVTSVVKMQRARFYVVVCLITVFLLLYGGTENAFGYWAASYGVEEYKMEKATAEYMDAVFWIAITVGRLIAVPMATRLSTKVMLGIDLGGCLVVAVLLIQFSRYKERMQSLLWACTVGLGLFMASIYGLAFSVPADLKVKLSGKAASAFIIAAGIGDVSVPALVGLMIKAIGNNAVVYSVAGLLILCVVIYVFVFSFGLSTVEKRLDDEELEELSRLNEDWEFGERLVISDEDKDDTR